MKPVRRQLIAAALFTPTILAAQAQTRAVGASEIDPKTRRRLPSLEAGEPASPNVAPASVISNIQNHSRLSLDGRWQWIIDPFDAARRKPRDRRAVWNDQIEQAGQTIIEYEWDSSPTIPVPGDWNTQVPELMYYTGVAYFRHQFELPVKQTNRRYFLVFDAVNYRSSAWMNQKRLGGHEGGFTPFSFEVTGVIREGRNLLVVRADNRHDDETLPAADFDWQNYGGITRSVHIVDVPATFVRTWHVRFDEQNIIAEAQLDGPELSGVPVKLSIKDLNWVASGSTDQSGRIQIRALAPKSLKLWSPTSPHLYEIQIQSGDDRQYDKVGFRHIDVRGKNVRLNGEPIFMRGISLHEESVSSQAGRHITIDQARKLLLVAKDLGCNFVRLAHYPHSEVMLRTADELGLLVWAELPVYWEDVSYESPKTLLLAKTMFTEMIHRDANRACVVMWSIANETPEIESRLQFLKSLAKHVRSMDASRLLTAALNKNADVLGQQGDAAKGRSFVIDDPLGEVLDVIGFNQYEAWYSNVTPEALRTVNFRSKYDKPLICSEFGADAPFGFHSKTTQRWSEEFQALLYEETLSMLDRVPGLVGLTPWVLKDFRSPRRWHGRFQQYWNRKGLISEDGRRKLAFEVLKKYYIKNQCSRYVL